MMRGNRMTVMEQATLVVLAVFTATLLCVTMCRGGGEAMPQGHDAAHDSLAAELRQGKVQKVVPKEINVKKAKKNKKEKAVGSIKPRRRDYFEPCE